MKLSKIALLALKGMDRTDRKDLAVKMGITEDTMYRWLKVNDEKFTLAANMAVLRQELGLSDTDLLEHDEVAA